MKNNGFTRIELFIVILILAALSIVALPIYRGYLNKAIYSEGEALLVSLFDAEKIYYSEFGTFYEIQSPTAYDEALDVNAVDNKIFQTYSVKVNNDQQPKTLTITVYGQDKGKEIVFTLTGEEESGEYSINSKI